MRSTLAALLLLAALVGADEAVLTPAPAGYRLYPGDQLQVQVFDHPDLALAIRVPSAGSIVFPLIGSIDGLVGRTVEDVAGELSRRLEDGYLRRASVTVGITGFGPRAVSVLGSVAKPRDLPLDPLARTTALAAVAAAGGFLDDANRAGTHVIRAPSADGQRVVVPVPVAKGGDGPGGGDVVLQPDDIVVVPRSDRVYVIGQVLTPSALVLPRTERITVSKAVAMAGGFTKFSRDADVHLIRGGEPQRTINVRATLSGGGGDDPEVLPGDIVYVPENRL